MRTINKNEAVMVTGGEIKAECHCNIGRERLPGHMDPWLDFGNYDMTKEACRRKCCPTIPGGETTFRWGNERISC